MPHLRGTILLEQCSGFLAIVITQLEGRRFGNRVHHALRRASSSGSNPAISCCKRSRASSFPIARHAGADARPAVQENDVLHAAFRSRANRQIRRQHFDRRLAVQLAADGAAAQLRKHVRRLRAKPEMMRLANHGPAAVPQYAAGIVRDIGPTAPRTGVGQRALAHPRLAIKQHAGAFPGHASGMQRSDIVQLQQHVNQRIQKMPAEENPVRHSRARHARVTEPLAPVDGREILLVRHPQSAGAAGRAVPAQAATRRLPRRPSHARAAAAGRTAAHKRQSSRGPHPALRANCWRCPPEIRMDNSGPHRAAARDTAEDRLLAVSTAFVPDIYSTNNTGT